MEINDLTPAEIELIRKSREERAAKEAARVFQRKAIATAYEFSKWSDEEGLSLSFSTFINTFGYQDDDGNQMYAAVERILKAAWPQ